METDKVNAYEGRGEGLRAGESSTGQRSPVRGPLTVVRTPLTVVMEKITVAMGPLTE